MAIGIHGCSSNENSEVEGGETDSTESSVPTVTDPVNPEDVIAAATFSCDEIATQFVTKGSANDDLPDPEVSAACSGEEIVVRSNSIPDFPYIETSPGVPGEFDSEYVIPATPIVAQTPTAVPVIGPIGIAINGIPIYAATEGPGGDVNSRPGGFTECGGHNGPTGYHYHLFDVNGSDVCLFSEEEASVEPQLFGYAFDGYPIYSGNFQYTSSWFLSDASLFATDTFSAHSYAEGSGDLDQCNGRTDVNGNYAYYTTDSFPYTLACYRGVVEIEAPTGPGGAR
ncbi:MAG: YHYH protein [Granulosicoccus sp.]